MTPGPLWRRAPLRLLRDGPWVLLLVAAFAVCAAAAAADVLSVSAWRTAAVHRVLDGVAEGAGPRASPSVRLSAVPGPGNGLDDLRERADAVPGLEPTQLLGVSFADELLGTRLVRYEGFAGAGGVRSPARLTAVDDPGAVLAVVDAVPDPVSSRSRPGAWIPVALADELGVAAGDDLEVGTEISRRGEALATVVVLGTYEATDGAVPVDRPGSTFWADRAGRLPGDAGGLGDPALVVGDARTIDRLARGVGDVIVWSLDADLDPALPGRDGLGETVAGVRGLRAAVASQGLEGDETGLTTAVVTGLEGLAASADDITRRAAAEARTPAIGSIVLGVALVVAVSVLTAARRAREHELLAGLGLRPPAVGLLALVEVLPAAVLGLLLGGPAALLAVRLLADVPPEPPALRLAAGQAAVVVLGGVLLHGVVTTLAAASAARRGARHAGAERVLPWRAGLVVAAAASVAGLLAAPVGQARGLDLSVPVLVSAAVGAVGAGLLRVVASGRAVRPRAARPVTARPVTARPVTARPVTARTVTARTVTARPVISAVDGGVPTGPPRAGALGTVVVRRRLAAGGTERMVVVTALATAFGLAAHVLVGEELVARAVRDKAAVLSGAELVVELEQAGQVDPGLPAEGYPRDLAVADGDTAVFRDSGRLPGDRTVDVLVVDLDTFAAVASWGTPGGPLERSRDALAVLAEADAAALPECPSRALLAPVLPPDDLPDPPPPPCPPRPAESEGLPLGQVATGPAPVLVVGDPAGQRVGGRVVLSGANGDVTLEVVGAVDAFPGVDTDLRTGFVAATGSYLPRLPNGDPRVTPLVDGLGPASLDVDGVELWSRRPLAAVAADLPAVEGTTATLSDERRIRTAGEVLVRPAFVAVELVAPYLQVLAGLVLAVGLLALCLSVDRAAVRARAGDVVLARVGLGRSGTRRLLAVEAAVLVASGLALGALGWLLTVPLLPRLLEPDPTVGPLLQAAAVPWAGTVLVGTALLALAAAAAVVAAGARGTSEEEVLRGQD